MTDRRPRCSRCRQAVTFGLWRVYSNGTVHLLPWCVGCQRQTDVAPLPKRCALSTFERAGQITALTD
jgi:hypothetical protein